MADPIREAGLGHNLSRATFLEFCTNHGQVERELAEVAETRRSLNRRRKDLRKNAVAAGIDIEMFDRHLVDIELTPEERDAQARSYLQMMTWRNAPPGFQATMDLPAEPGARALNYLELHAIDGEGFDAGKSGRRRDSNPHRPGSEPHQRWDNAWGRGQATAVETQMGDGNPAPAAEPTRRRGRPRRNAAAEPPANGADGNGHDAGAERAEHTMPTEPPPPADAGEGLAAGGGEPSGEPAPAVH